MYKPISLILIPSLILPAILLSAQCNWDISFETEIEGRNEGKIFLLSSDLEGYIQIKLYDMQKAGNKFHQTKRIFINRGTRTLVFNNLESSSYLIQIEKDGCKVNYGGINGINFTAQNE